MTTQQPEALRLADSYEATYLPGHLEVAAELRRLHARVQELEEDLQLARQGIGAEAYDMACEEMEAYQLKRAKAGKEAGTTLSLVDGMAWVYERLDELEAQVQRAPLTDEEKQNLLKEWSYSQFTGNGDFLDGVEAAERAHGIT